jgi:hypothetical protein
MNNEDTSPVDSEVVAMIAAAVAAVLAQPHRIVAVKKIEMPPAHLNAWAFVGRIELTRSHRIR